MASKSMRVLMVLSSFAIVLSVSSGMLQWQDQFKHAYVHTAACTLIEQRAANHVVERSPSWCVIRITERRIGSVLVTPDLLLPNSSVIGLVH